MAEVAAGVTAGTFEMDYVTPLRFAPPIVLVADRSVSTKQHVEKSVAMKPGRIGQSPRHITQGRAPTNMRPLLRAGLAALTLVTATAAHADIGRAHTDASVEESVPSGAVSEVDARQVEIDRFKAAPVSLREALAIVQDRRGGSRAVDASFDSEAGVSTYQIRTQRGNRLWQDVVDAHTGATINTEAGSALADLAKPDRELLARLGAVRQELSDAVIVAERNTRGRAISAGLMVERGRLQFVIVCVAGNDLKQVMLEPPAPRARAK
ncbi:PepSY domain-containing protein [Bradyrhizobium oligotrophicum]|uniref:PepSY domain-containing protein n=1 Tax=Bradyrhizobium oligotrophicum TaxID=44255 RepID=UPI003EBA2B65